MDANSFLRRIILIAVASTLPVFASVASAHGGGHPGGSSGGSSSNGSSGGHSSSGSNSGHSASASKSGHPAGDPSGPAAMTGGRSVLVSSVRPSTVRSNEVHQFSRLRAQRAIPRVVAEAPSVFLLTVPLTLSRN